jgi:hypothetical protein
MKFRVTYWPGTAKMSSHEVANMTQAELDSIARRWEFEARNYHEAQVMSAGRLIDSSDGCLIEFQNDAGEYVTRSVR